MVTLGTTGAGLCCPQPGQLLPTHLNSPQPSMLEVVTRRGSTMGSTCPSLVDARVTLHGGVPTARAWSCYPSRVRPLPSSVWSCTWPLECPGMQDLICVLSHAVWEGSSHPALSVRSFSLLPSYVPFTCPFSLGSMPSCSFREGLLSQQSNYPTCQQEQLHLRPLTRMFCLFCLSSLLYGQHCWTTTFCCPGSAALLLCTYCPAVVPCEAN